MKTEGGNLLANEIGSCDGSTTSSIPSSGRYWLEIYSSGRWSIGIDMNAPDLN